MHRRTAPVHDADQNAAVASAIIPATRHAALGSRPPPPAHAADPDMLCCVSQIRGVFSSSATVASGTPIVLVR